MFGLTGKRGLNECTEILKFPEPNLKAKILNLKIKNSRAAKVSHEKFRRTRVSSDKILEAENSTQKNFSSQKFLEPEIPTKNSPEKILKDNNSHKKFFEPKIPTKKKF